MDPAAIRTVVVGLAVRGRLGPRRAGAFGPVAAGSVAAPARPEATPGAIPVTPAASVAAAAAGDEVVGDLPGALSGRRPVLGPADRSSGQVPPSVAATGPVAVVAGPPATVAVQDRHPAL